MKKIRLSHLFVYVLIVFLGIFLRTFRLNEVPARLTIDEMSIGYNAYSLIQTGLDEWGKSWPLVFRAFGDYKLPLYIYLSIPFVRFLGMNVVSIRMLSVISGLSMIISIGLLSQLLLKSKKAGYLAALLIAISPWPVFISRMGLESNLGLALFCGALYFLAKMFEEKSRNYAIIVGILFGLSWYAYITFRLVTAIGLLVLLFLGLQKHAWRRQIALMLVSFIICILPLSRHILDFSGRARFQQISIFSDIGYVSEINEDRTFCYLQDKTSLPRICSILFNKPLSWVTAFTTNYLQALSPAFLFTDGGEAKYLSVPGFGEFFVILLPFYFIGIVWWFKKKETVFRLLGLLWLISPVASALAGPAHVVRASSVIPFVILAMVFGLRVVWRYIAKPRSRLFFVLGFTLCGIIVCGRYFVNYYYVYPAQFDSVAYPLPPELGTYMASVALKYKKIYFAPIGPGLHMFTAYYLAYPPDQYRRDVVWPNPDAIGFTHPHILGKFEYDTKSMDEVLDSSESGVLYVDLKQSKHIPMETFYNFSHVHPQAKVYDIDTVRTYELLHPETVSQN